MQIHGSLFMKDGDRLEVHTSELNGTPILTLDTLSVHLPNEAKLLELLDRIAAYLSMDAGEPDPAAEACREVGRMPMESEVECVHWFTMIRGGSQCGKCGERIMAQARGSL